MRFASQGKGEYADRMLAMMRKGFGGHKVTERVTEQVTERPPVGSSRVFKSPS